jgi:hypothetical protein
MKKVETSKTLMDLELKCPRFLIDKEAAATLGLELSQFHHWVSTISTGRLPPPFPDIHKWDVVALHAAIDRLSGIGNCANALEAWRDRRGAG